MLSGAVWLLSAPVSPPTFFQVVVVYFKRRRRPIFRPPPAVAGLWKLGSRIGGRARGMEQVETKPDDAEDTKVMTTAFGPSRFGGTPASPGLSGKSPCSHRHHTRVVPRVLSVLVATSPRSEGWLAE